MIINIYHIYYIYTSFTSPLPYFFRWNRIFPKFNRAADFELQMRQLQISVPRSHNNRMPYNDKLMQIMSFLWTYGSNDQCFQFSILVCQQSSKHRTLMNFLPHALCLTWCLNYSTPHVEKSDPNSLRADWLGKHLGGQLQMQPNVPSFSRVVSSVGIGRTSTFDTNAMAEKDFETTAHNFLFGFSIFLSPSKNRSQLQQSQGTSSCCDEVILKTSFRGCDGSESSKMRSMDFPWRDRKFPAGGQSCNKVMLQPYPHLTSISLTSICGNAAKKSSPVGEMLDDSASLEALCLFEV